MLEDNEKLDSPLSKRKPENSLFLLLTPKLFKENPKTRFYGYKFNDYKYNPSSIRDELEHRNLNEAELIKLSKRLGWTTWEDLKEINSECCKWLD